MTDQDEAPPAVFAYAQPAEAGVTNTPESEPEDEDETDGVD